MTNNLKIYLVTIGMTFKDFGVIADYSGKYLSRVSAGRLPVTKRLARDIERVTDGEVKLTVSTRKTKRHQEGEECNP